VVEKILIKPLAQLTQKTYLIHPKQLLSYSGGHIQIFQLEEDRQFLLAFLSVMNLSVDGRQRHERGRG
jgi:hypothetical protein